MIDELNLTWSAFLSVHLELIRWETHGVPGFGADAQDVLNAEFGDDYDIFVGVMWRKFGTPTGRAGSGTEEEFNRAHARWKQDPKAVSIMFYFRRTLEEERRAVPQGELVHKFQHRLGKMGGLWWEYRNPEEFTALLRIHLSRQVQSRLGPLTRKRVRVVEENFSYLYSWSDCQVRPRRDVGGGELRSLEQLYSYGVECRTLLWIFAEVRSVFEDIGGALMSHLRVLDEKEPGDVREIKAQMESIVRALMRDFNTLTERLTLVLPRLTNSYTSVLTQLSQLAPLIVDDSPHGKSLSGTIQVSLLELITALE